MGKVRSGCFNFIVITIILSQGAASCNGARILFFTGLASHSHRVAMQPLATKLAAIGHAVTFLSPIRPEKPNPNITEFSPKVFEELNLRTGLRTGKLAVEQRLRSRYNDPLLHGTYLWDIAYEVQESFLRSREFGNWFNNASFDLVIVDHPLKEIAFALAFIMRAKSIAFGTGGAPIMSDMDLFGMPIDSYWLEDWSLGSSLPLLPDRIVYAYGAISWYLSYTWYYLPKLDQLVRSQFGDGIPQLESLVRSVDLYFVNEHYSYGRARALPPFVIPVAGIHTGKPSPLLPQNIQDFLGQDEFVFISFGSIIRITYLPDSILDMMLAAVGGFKGIKFLWKWENGLPNRRIRNVLFQSWFPQNDILGHPKCKGFISQGGALSLQQAANHGIPVVVIPVWGDQSFNARSAAYHGNGIHLELVDISENSFTNAIQELVYNETLSEKAKEVSRQFKDRPMSALDTALWWTEYVLRNNQTSHLKSVGSNKTWWERRLLDFWLFVLCTLAALSGITGFTMYAAFRLCEKYLLSKLEKVKDA